MVLKVSLDILYQDNNQMVFVCQGSSRQSSITASHGSCRTDLVSKAVYNAAKSGRLANRDAKGGCVRAISSSGVSAIAKVLTPVLHTLMDRNLFEVSLYGSMMSRAVRDEPEWVIQVAQQMEGVLPQRKE